jgi:hypothetical protein
VDFSIADCQNVEKIAEMSNIFTAEKISESKVSIFIGTIGRLRVSESALIFTVENFSALIRCFVCIQQSKKSDWETVRPNWANFRLLGDCLLRVVMFKLLKYLVIFVIFFFPR